MREAQRTQIPPDQFAQSIYPFHIAHIRIYIHHSGQQLFNLVLFTPQKPAKANWQRQFDPGQRTSIFLFQDGLRKIPDRSNLKHFVHHASVIISSHSSSVYVRAGQSQTGHGINFKQVNLFVFVQTDVNSSKVPQSQSSESILAQPDHFICQFLRNICRTYLAEWLFPFVKLSLNSIPVVFQVYFQNWKCLRITIAQQTNAEFPSRNELFHQGLLFKL